MPLRTELICITLLESLGISDEELRVSLNAHLGVLAKTRGELKAYTLLSDYTNKAGSRFVKFLATFAVEDMPGLSPNKKG